MEHPLAEVGPPERGPLFRVVRDQRVAFVIIGGFNTVLGTAWFIGFQLLFESLSLGRFDYVLSLVCAHAASVLCSFVMQRLLVFRVRGHFGRDFVRFTGVSLTALGLNLVLLTLLVEGTTLPTIPAQLIVTAVIAVGTYFAHRDFSFRREGRVKEAPRPTEPGPDDTVHGVASAQAVNLDSEDATRWRNR